MGHVRHGSGLGWRPTDRVAPEQGKAAKGGLGWAGMGVGSTWDGHMGRGEEVREGRLLALPDQALPTSRSLARVYHLLHAS